MSDHQISLSDLLLLAGGNAAAGIAAPGGRQDALQTAELEWWAAIAAITQLLGESPRPTGRDRGCNREGHPSATEGTVISGPLPVLTEPALTQRFATWVLTPQPLAEALMGPRSLLPAEPTGATCPLPTIQALPIQASDTCLSEQFCFVFTATLSGVWVLGKPTGHPWQLQYSFDPALLLQVWERLRSSIHPGSEQALGQLTQQLAALNTLRPDYQVITRFSHLLIGHLPHRHRAEGFAPMSDSLKFAHWSPNAPTESTQATNHRVAGDHPSESTPGKGAGLDAELLQAMAHEIRTPLTTIRTLTRSLLRRADLDTKANQRLQRIDQECTQQIERFNLIFRAAELTGAARHPLAAPLAPIALTQVFEAAIPQWQQQAHRRNLSLDVRLPTKLPRVTSDPTLLSQVLTGMVEWFTQGLPAQSHIQMGVTLAGSQLKLQFKARSEDSRPADHHDTGRAQLKSLGQLLTVAPDTGGVSLNLDATKTLFEALGAKLTVRQRPHQGETLTVFLPLDTREV